MQIKLESLWVGNFHRDLGSLVRFGSDKQVIWSNWGWHLNACEDFNPKTEILG